VGKIQILIVGAVFPHFCRDVYKRWSGPGSAPPYQISHYRGRPASNKRLRSI